MGKRNISLERAECPLCNGIQLVIVIDTDEGTNFTDVKGTESRTVTSLHIILTNKAQPCKCA